MSTAFITGASGFLGTATTQEFIDHGFDIVGVDRKFRDDPVFSHKQMKHKLSLDLLDEELVRKKVSELGESHNFTAAILIAGGFGMGSFEDTSADDIQQMIDLNFKTAHHVARAMFTSFKNSGGGKLIFVTSKPAVDPGGSFATAYAISKQMLVKMVDVINEEGRPHQISATAIAPEIIDTPVNRNAMPDADFNAWQTPDDIARNILHLCTEGKYIREDVIRLFNKK